MRKEMLMAAMLAALPLAALAQGPQASGQGAQGQQQGAGQRMTPERMEKRMRLARTLGLAEALDLDASQALRLGDTIAKFDDRRLAAHKQLRDARDVLHRAAKGDKVTAAEVDQAIQKGLDARAQLQAVDRDTVSAVTQGLTPEKKARAVLFLAKFQARFPGHMMMMRRGMMEHGGPGGGMHGPGGHGGMGGGMGGGWGMGPGNGDGPMGMAPPPAETWDDELED